jgi:hypothetical protein
MHHRDATGARIAKGDGHIDVLHADPSSLDNLADAGVNIALYMGGERIASVVKRQHPDDLCASHAGLSLGDPSHAWFGPSPALL